MIADEGPRLERGSANRRRGFPYDYSNAAPSTAPRSNITLQTKPGKCATFAGHTPANALICRCEEFALAAFVPYCEGDVPCYSDCDPASAHAQRSCAPVFYDSSSTPSMWRECAARLCSPPGKRHIAAPATGGIAACTDHSKRRAAESVRDACPLPRYARSGSPECGPRS